jgi:hypothetical protein
MHTIREIVGELHGNTRREPSLARTAWTQQGDERRGREEASQSIDFLFATDKACELVRKVADRSARIALWTALLALSIGPGASPGSPLCLLDCGDKLVRFKSIQSRLDKLWMPNLQFVAFPASNRISRHAQSFG